MAVSTNPVALDETLQATNEKLNDIKTVLETANFGRGIDNISKTSTSGLVDTYTIEYTDDTTTTYNVTNGRNGTDGVDGVSPSANVSKVGNTATITIVDGSGTSTAAVTDGTNGTDGTSPIANVEKVGSTATITVIDAQGTTTASISDGLNGTNGVDGQDGTSLTASSSKSGKVTTVLIKNAETEEILTTLTINDGEDGSGGGGDMRKAVYDTNEDGIVDAAETLDGLTASVTELNYMDGVTSNVQTQLDGKVDSETGKGLSSNDYTTEEKTKLSGIANGAEVNVIGSVDSDFSVSSDKQLSLSNTVKGKLVEAVNPTLVGTETSVNGLQIGNTKYKVGGGHEMLSTKTEFVNNTDSGKVVDSLVLKTFSNVFKKRIIVENIPIGATGVGTWINHATPWATSEMADWIQNDLLIVPDNAEDVEFSFLFSVDDGEAISMSGYQWDSTLGKMCIKFGNKLTKVGKIAIDIINLNDV